MTEHSPSEAPRRPAQAPPPINPNPVLGVFGLSIRTRERDLEDEFMRYGDVEKVVIVYDQRVDIPHFKARTIANFQSTRLIVLEVSAL